MNSHSNTSNKNSDQFRELVFSTETPEQLNLKTKKVNEQTLFEQDTKKVNNVNERSFILIDQRYRVPLLNQLYSGQQAQKTYTGTKNYKTFISNEDSDSRYLSLYQDRSTLIEPAPVKAYNEKRIEDTRVKFYEPPKHNNYNAVTKNAIVDELNNLKMKVQAANRAIGYQYQDKRKKNILNRLFNSKGVVNERLEYLELLKAPITRTGVNAANVRNNYIVQAGRTNEDYDNKLSPRLNKKMFSPSHSTLSTQRETIQNDNYKPATFDKQEDNYRDNNAAWKLEEMSMNSDTRLDENVYRASDEDREVFDKFIKDKSSDRDEKRNINFQSNTDTRRNLCLIPGCIPIIEKPVKYQEAKCKCDMKVDEYLKSDTNESVEVTPSQQYSDKNADENVN